jgi:hypothetical protein
MQKDKQQLVVRNESEQLTNNATTQQNSLHCIEWSHTLPIKTQFRHSQSPTVKQARGILPTNCKRIVHFAVLLPVVDRCVMSACS